jgi:DNA-binding NarL/FixJ family response regulator
MVVDDQLMVRAGIAAIVDAEEGLEVVGEAADGQSALDLAARLRPDVVLMDIRMPGMDGLTATALLTAAAPETRVLVLTTFHQDRYVYEALRAGAAGFVLKDAGAEEILAAARAVAGGAAWFDPAVTPRVLSAYRGSVAPAQRAARPLQLLTAREREVLELIARGATNAEIAAALFLSEATVKSHVGSIFTKLGLRDRAAVIVYAFDHGVVRPRD